MRTIYFGHDQQEPPDERKNYLESSGYIVELFRNSSDLINAFRDGRPDLVLLDVLIEGKNGFEAALELNSLYPERSFPIVICSHIYRSRAFREEALRCGASDYLLLPLSFDELLRRVGQAIAYFVAPTASAKPAPAKT